MPLATGDGRWAALLRVLYFSGAIVAAGVAIAVYIFDTLGRRLRLAGPDPGSVWNSIPPTNRAYLMFLLVLTVLVVVGTLIWQLARAPRRGRSRFQSPFSAWKFVKSTALLVVVALLSDLFLIGNATSYAVEALTGSDEGIGPGLSSRAFLVSAAVWLIMTMVEMIDVALKKLKPSPGT